MARPSKADQWLTDDGLLLLEHWKRNDLSDAEIAKRIGISGKTLCTWKERYLQISSALKKGLDYAVADAEKALVEKFKVQTITEEKEEVWKNDDGTIKKHKIVTKKQIAPDTTAIIFFLKAKGGWRDNFEITDNTAIDKLDQILKETQENSIAEIKKEEEGKEDGEG